MKRSLASFVLVIAAACSAAPPPAEQGPTSNATLFEGARLITGDGSTPVEDSAILIEGDQISRVGKKGEIQLPGGAQRVDLTGKTVMPALVDAHSHLGYTDVKRNPNVFVIPNLPDRGVAEIDEWVAETVPMSEVKRAHDALNNRTAAQVKQQADLFAVQARNLAKLNAAGVTIGYGTDAGVSVGWPAHAERVDMVAAGMTPSQVIVAATRTSAAILEIDQLGGIAPGKSADFIVLDANPLDDIANTRKIDRVYLRGEAIDRAALRKSWRSEI